MDNSKNKINNNRLPNNLWVIIDHPLQIPYALSIARFCKLKKIKVNLIVSKHEYWEKVDKIKVENKFSNVKYFKRFNYPPHNMNVVKQFLAAIILIFQLIYLMAKVKFVPINKKDVIVGLAGCVFLENMIIRSHSCNHSVAVIRKTSLLGLTKPDHNKYKYTVGGVFSKYIYEPLFGLNKIYYFKKNISGNVSDGTTVLRYVQKTSRLYDKVLAMTNIADNLKSEVAELDENVKIIYFPTYAKTANKTKRKKKIIFFGTSFVKSPNIKQSIYVSLTNQCLDYIRKQYGNTYMLCYRPHPRETIEEKLLDLTNFEIEKDGMLAEMYFQEHTDSIHSVFSVGSTASKSALGFGVNGYVFVKLYPFKRDTIKMYNDLFGKMPDNFFIQDLKQNPKKLNLNKHQKGNWQLFVKDFKWAITR